jgi:MHS family proline/betaine transporter-like MFS transporter
VANWGWRIPFIGSVVFCLAGWLLRRGLHETSEGLKAKSIRPPLITSLIADWLPMLRTFGIVAPNNAAYYLTFTYMVDRRKSLAMHGSEFLLMNTISLVVVLLAKVLGGWLSDRVGRRRLMLMLTLGIIVAIYPALILMVSGSLWRFLLGQVLIAVPVGMAGGLHGAMLVEIFPLRSRVTSMSIAYSSTLALAGGTAPLICAWLTSTLGHALAPAYYIALLGMAGVALLWPMRETNGNPLDE